MLCCSDRLTSTCTCLSTREHTIDLLKMPVETLNYKGRESLLSGNICLSIAVSRIADNSWRASLVLPLGISRRRPLWLSQRRS